MRAAIGLVAVWAASALTACVVVPHDVPAAPRAAEVPEGAAEARPPFHDALAPHGEWRPTRRGWVWRPADVPPSWRPYSEGRWRLTDWGWTWESDRPWGWVVFHYGRWERLSGLGWVWVPGDMWAPAWVAWRWNRDWVGWAPLPPGTPWRPEAGLGLHAADVDFLVDPRAWSFVRVRDLAEERLARRLVLPWSWNRTLARTRVSLPLEPIGERIVNVGLPAERVEALTGAVLPRYRLVDAPEPVPPGTVPEGGELPVYRPSAAPPPDLIPWDARDPETAPAPRETP